MEVLKLTDARVRGLVAKLLRDFAANGERFDAIAGITRGGLVPANLISQYLELPLITVNWSLRDHARTDMPAVEHMADLLIQDKRILLVDDICDDGHTLKAVWDEVAQLAPDWVEGNFPSAVLVHNLGGDLFTPDFAGMEINKAELPMWLEFPWENWWIN